MNDPFSFGSNQNNLSSTNSTAQKKKPQTASFLESLREQGKTATSGIAQGAVDQLFGGGGQANQKVDNSSQPANPNQQPFNFAEFLKLREQKIRQQERTLSEQQRRTETVVFSQKEESAKKEIEFIKEEIKKIIKETGDVAIELIEAEKTAMTTTVEAGTYQINFFQRIRSLLAIARKRIAESKNWLEMFNSRQKQKSYYWGQVKKSGTKYLLSNERYMATQAG
ncbi:hypothetical protein GYA49_01865 [Candidatus Beckwithbacteria bacterium]|nr:hypothetical protein [Candidatus Beckwithbacteria bacterium]